MTDREKLEEMQVKARASHLSQEKRIEKLEQRLITATLLLKRTWKIHQYGELYPEQAGEHALRVREFAYGCAASDTQHKVAQECEDGR